MTDSNLVWSDTTTSGCNRKVFIMYHSTKTWQNAMSILENGFQSSRASENMLGAGIYVSRSLDKARAYGPITFKLLVYTGFVKVIKEQGDPMQKSWQEHYSCAWVPPGCGMVASGREVRQKYLLYL